MTKHNGAAPRVAQTLRFLVLMAAVSLFARASCAGDSIRVVSTPNPNVFPLLVALAERPELPVVLDAVPDGASAARELREHRADAVVAMTYAEAKWRDSRQVPDLRLLDVTFWRGFSLLSPAELDAPGQLAGQGVIVSGPVGGGKDGAPDMILRAALKRAGVDLSALDICYLPVKRAASLLDGQKPMDSEPACHGQSQPLAVSMVEPAATGLIMQSRMTGRGALQRSLALEPLFQGFDAWSSDELPHGGLAVRAPVLSDPRRAAEMALLRAAYRDGADAIMRARGHPLAMLRVAREISGGIQRAFGAEGMSLPVPVLIEALRSGELEFRTDRPLPAIAPDLLRFLDEVTGMTTPQDFLVLTS